MTDEILLELWQIKDELTREANYDVHLLCQKLRAEHATLRGQIVDRSGGQLGAGPRRENVSRGSPHGAPQPSSSNSSS